MKVKFYLIVLSIALPLMASCQRLQPKPATQPITPAHHKSAEETYIDRQLKIIDQHKALLVRAGRVTDPDHFDAALYLASYGWHTSCDIGKSMSGTDGRNAMYLAEEMDQRSPRPR